MECIILPLRQNLSQGQAGLSSAGMYGALNFYFCMWGFEVCVSMHVEVRRWLSGVSCLVWKWVLGARGSTRHQLSAGSFTTELS